MEELACPRCKTTKYRNPHLKLMVNTCGHALCDNCVELLFVRGSGECPECHVALRKNNFRVQLFEDACVEKEVDIRKRILKDYNKKEEDFSSLREYNDYLEEVEDIIFNLTNGVDVESTKKRIDDYKRQNQTQIKKNRNKLSKDDLLLEEMIEIERQERSFYREQAQQEEAKAKTTKRRNKEALIDELMFSDLDAKHIVAAHKKEQQAHKEEIAARPREKPTTFSSGISLAQSNVFAPVPTKESFGELYEYKPSEIEICGPEPPTWEEITNNGYLVNIRAATAQDRAGGYETQIGCQRALQEAFCGLFFTMKEIS